MSLGRFFISVWFAMAFFGISQVQSAAAQAPSGQISGTVTDASGGAVANAEVSATNEANGEVRKSTSSAAGEFSFQNLPSGTYSIGATAPGFQAFHISEISVTADEVSKLQVRLTVEASRKVVVVQGDVPDDYEATSYTLGNFNNLPLQDTPVSALVVSRSLMDDQQARLLSDVAKNDAAVGENYAPVGWYQDFEIRGFTIDLASGIKVNGLSVAGEQMTPLENKESVEFLKGVDGLESGVASGGGLINYVTKRPAYVRTLNFATDHRGTIYGGLDLGGFFGAEQQFGLRANVAAESIQSYVNGANGSRAMGAVAADWKINASTFLKGDFDYQHLVQKSVGGYQLLGGSALPVDVSPDVMLGFQPWAKPNTYDDFNTSARLDHTLSANWRFFVAGDFSHTLLDDNIAYPYGCYYVDVCNLPGAKPYFFSPSGDYDVYDYRSPGEVRINDQFEAILQGRVKTGPITNDVAIGTSLQRRSVNLPNPVYDYVGTENIYQPLQTFAPSSNQPGPVELAEDTHQYALIVEDHIHLPARIDVSVGGQYDTLHDFLFPSKSVWLPQYSISFRPISQLLLYGNYSVALSLGLQAPFWATNSNAFLEPFFTRQVEAGIKYNAGRRILLTTAVYRIRAPFFYPKPDDEGNVTFLSEGHETHRGVELSAQGKVTNWLNVTSSTAFLQAVSSGTLTPDFNGKQVINVPRFRTTLFADLDVPHISGLHLLPGWSYTSSKEAARDDSVSVPGYNLFNFGARYTPGGEWSRVTFRIYAENVLNKRYWKDTGASYGDTFLHPGAPTTLRLSAQYSF
jgi:iron complex outermembrane recepter protein